MPKPVFDTISGSKIGKSLLRQRYQFWAETVNVLLAVPLFALWAVEGLASAYSVAYLVAAALAVLHDPAELLTTIERQGI